jgi:hypothetical protein
VTTTHPLNRFTGWALAAVLAVLAGCKGPAAAVYPPDRGRPIDPASVAGFRQGSTTRAEAIQRLGEPTATASNPADGVSTLTWQHAHADAAGFSTTTLILKFGPDEKLIIKFLNQDRQSR